MSASFIPTPHNEAKPGDFADTVLMPGDPLRAKFIAENYLEDVKMVNNVRGIHGYTGFYNGKRVSVMASGMGMPTMGIYSYELFNFYDVKSIIRIGSAGGIAETLKVRDIIAGMSAYTNSNYGEQFGFRGHLAPCCSYELLTKAVAAGEKLEHPLKVGAVFSSDRFYDETEPHKALAKLGVLGVEMEAAALYLNAAQAGKSALCLATVTDHMVTGESLPAADRQLTLTKMIEIALMIA